MIKIQLIKNLLIRIKKGLKTRTSFSKNLPTYQFLNIKLT